MTRRDDLRRKALANLQESEVLMLDGHFDYGNGYHGRLYLNPHQIFRQPSLIWRFAQDLIEILPEPIVQAELARGTKKSYEKLRADHLADYQPLFRRVSLALRKSATSASGKAFVNSARTCDTAGAVGPSLNR